MNHFTVSRNNFLTRSHNLLVRKRILSHLAKLVNGLSSAVSTDMYVAFGCMFLSYHVGILEWISRKSFFYKDVISEVKLIKCQCYYHRETSQLVCFSNQLTSFYMMETFVFNDLSDCNGTESHKHWVCKWTINYLSKLAKVWLSVRFRTKWLLDRLLLLSLKL